MISHETHGIAPVFDSNSAILILGSFPSVKSRQTSFFYGHPQNRFWPLLSQLLKEPLPASVDEKKRLLIKHHIAVWDVIESCDIEGSSDSSIKNATPNRLSLVLDAAPIRQIYTNGAASCRLYKACCQPLTGRPAIQLPSTSPANAAFSMERLKESWRIILENLPDIV